jgi:hypothetical protein
MVHYRLFIILLFLCANADAQPVVIRHKKKSNAHIQDLYKKYIVVRAYESTKFNNFRFIDGKSKVIYKPNEHNNLGIGFTYKYLSLNLGFHIPFADKNPDVYGKTRQLDLQTHIYKQKYIIDFFGQFYRGFYLDNPSALANYTPGYIIKRPDMRSRDISLQVQYVFNNSQFSYNAPTYQNEIQKKSAGSFIAGAGIFHANARADSSIIPPGLADTAFFRGQRFTQTGHIGVGASFGYGYTLVIYKYFFATAIVTGGAGVGYSWLQGPGGSGTSSWAPKLDVNLRCAVGYNYGRYFAGVTYIRLQTMAGSVYPGTWLQTNRGNFRVIVAKRFRYRKDIIPQNGLLKAD